MSHVAPPVPGYPGTSDFQGYGSPQVPQPIATTKNADGTTKSANGQIPNSSIVFSNPS
jgi:hypothetical protein